MNNKVYTNKEKLEYYKRKLSALTNEAKHAEQRITELTEICKHDADGITFQNWSVGKELIELARALAHGEEIESNYKRKA